MMGPKCSYIDFLDQHTDNKELELSQTKSDFFPLRPSSSGKCTRELAYELAEFRGLATYTGKELKTPETKRLLDLGHSIEHHLFKQFEGVPEFKLKYKQQVLSFFKLPTGEIIEGSIDAVIYSEKFKCVIDCKSKKEKFSSFYSDDWIQTNEKYKAMANVISISDNAFYIEDIEDFVKNHSDPFLSSNIYQLNLYFFDESRFLRDRGVDHAALIFYSKNTSRLRELRFKPSKALYNEVKVKYLLVSDVVDNKKDPTLAPKDYSLGSLKCAFCNFKKECHPQDDALKAYFSTWPKKVWPIDALKVDKDLASLYQRYKECSESLDQAKRYEEKIIKILDDNKIEKVKFSDGHVYELKMLKSPRPHLEFRRTKI